MELGAGVCVRGAGEVGGGTAAFKTCHLSSWALAPKRRAPNVERLKLRFSSPDI